MFNAMTNMIRPHVVYATEVAVAGGAYDLMLSLMTYLFAAMGLDIVTGDEENTSVYLDEVMEEFNQLVEDGSIQLVNDEYSGALKVLGSYKSCESMSELLADFLEVCPESSLSSVGVTRDMCRYIEYEEISGSKAISLNNNMMKVLADVVYTGIQAISDSNSWENTKGYYYRANVSNAASFWQWNFYLTDYELNVPGLDEYLDNYSTYIIYNKLLGSDKKSVLNDSINDREWYAFFSNEPIEIFYKTMAMSSRYAFEFTDVLNVQLTTDGVEVIEEGMTGTYKNFRCAIRYYQNLDIASSFSIVDADGNKITSLPSSYEYGVSHTGAIPAVLSGIDALTNASTAIPLDIEDVLEGIGEDVYVIPQDSSKVIEAVDSAVLGLDGVLEDERTAVYPGLLDEAMEGVKATVQEGTDALILDKVATVMDEAPTYSVDMTTSGLANKFPFCIPFDLINAIKMLGADAEAPYFEIPIVNERLGINEVIVIDFAPFEVVASVCRVVETFIFMVTLILLTRDKIKG